MPEPSSTKSTLPSSYGRLLPNSKYSTFFRNANGSYAFRPGQTDRYTSKELIPEAIREVNSRNDKRRCGAADVRRPD